MSKPLVVTIPGTPDKALTPNGAGNRMAKYRANQQAIKDAYYSTRNANAEIWEPALPLTLHYIVAWEKGHKRMDDDNLKASLKGYQDGIAKALDINDRHMIVGTVTQTRDKEGRGFIRVAIEPATEQDTTT